MAKFPTLLAATAFSLTAGFAQAGSFAFTAPEGASVPVINGACKGFLACRRTGWTNGVDRTGTLAYILNGLLGVGADDLDRDYHLTARASASGSSSVRRRSTIPPCVRRSSVVWG